LASDNQSKPIKPPANQDKHGKPESGEAEANPDEIWQQLDSDTRARAIQILSQLAYAYVHSRSEILSEANKPDTPTTEDEDGAPPSLPQA